MGLVAFSLTITLDLEAVDQSGEVYKFLKNWKEGFYTKFLVLTAVGVITLFIGVWWYERKIKKLNEN